MISAQILTRQKGAELLQSFLEGRIVMRHLMTTKIPFVLHRFVALVTSHIASDCVHVQDVLDR